MSSITHAISNLFASILNIITGIFSALFSSVQSVLAVGMSLLANVGHLARGLVDLVLSMLLPFSCALVPVPPLSLLAPTAHSRAHHLLEGNTSEVWKSDEGGVVVQCATEKALREAEGIFLLMRVLVRVGNIVFIGVAVALLVGYSAYQQRQGGSTMSKKMGKKMN